MFIRYGQDKLHFSVPSDWDVSTFADFEDTALPKDINYTAKRALADPIDAMPLDKQLNPSDKIAILIEDQTRNSPKQHILRIILDCLHNISIPTENISIIIALGTHGNLSIREIKDTYGGDLFEKYKFYNHDSSAPDLVPIGNLKSGTTVKINKLAYDSDYRIGIGSIFPHPLNGFGGGGKILFPGIANSGAILEHHLKYCFRNGSEMGRLHGNPFYEEISHLAEAGRLNFIVNSVLDHNDNLYDVVAGHPLSAHKAGANICKKIITRKFARKSDLTIISAFPYTQATQLMKPFAPASLITNEAGIIILAGFCTTRFPLEYLDACADFRSRYKGRLKEAIFEYFDGNRCIIAGGAPELNMSLAQVILALDSYRVILMSSELSRYIVEKLGFIHAKTIEEAILISSRYVNKPVVNIIPSGGIIIPELQ